MFALIGIGYVVKVKIRKPPIYETLALILFGALVWQGHSVFPIFHSQEVTTVRVIKTAERPGMLLRFLYRNPMGRGILAFAHASVFVQNGREVFRQ